MEIYIKCPKNYDNKNNIKIINGNRIELPKNLKPSEKFKIKIKKIINVKIFKNGRIQITGLKYENQGIQIIHKLIDLLNKNSIVNNDIQLKMIDYSIVLINCDFELSHGIDRYKLHDKLIEKNYYSSFEPCNYPGVNIKYYINDNNNNGICCCNKICNGKGNGKNDGDCKRITIAVFKSGSIIITGGRNINQILISYDFINKFIKEHLH